MIFFYVIINKDWTVYEEQKNSSEREWDLSNIWPDINKHKFLIHTFLFVYFLF